VTIVAGAWFGKRGLGSRTIHAWSWYHYYLGAKYFDELGYYGLYEQTLVAQRADGGPLAEIRRIRDLRTYQPIIPPGAGELARAPGFSDARWHAFKADVATLVAMLPLDTWRRVLLDRGYNATPTSDALARPLVGVLDLSNETHLWLAQLFDVVGLLLLTVLLWWVFGWPIAAMALAALFLFPPTAGRFFGGMIKYDWFFVITLVPILLRRNRPASAGAMLGIATCLRVFPVVFLAAFGVRAAFRAYDENALPRRELRVMAGFCAAVLLGLGVGALPPGGIDRWRAFSANIGTHNSEMTYGDGRVGLRHLFTHRIGAKPESIPERRANLREARTVVLAVQAALLVLLLLALRRRDELDAFVLASLLLFIFSVASHYYWAILALWPLLGCADDGRSRTRRWLGPAVAIVPSLLCTVYAHFEPNTYMRWIFMDACLVVAFTSVLVALIWRDVSAARGWKNFLARPDRIAG
jgi:hypothetical protein